MLELTIGSVAVLVWILAFASTLIILVDIVAGAGGGAGAGDISAAVAVAVAVTAGDSDDERNGSLKELLELEVVVPLLQPLGSVPRGGAGGFTWEHAEQETLGGPTLLGGRLVQVDGGKLGLQDVQPQVCQLQGGGLSDLLESELLTGGGTGVPRIDEVSKTVDDAEAELEEGGRVAGAQEVGDSHGRDGFELLVENGGPIESQERMKTSRASDFIFELLSIFVLGEACERVSG